MKILVTGSIAYDVLLNYDGSFVDALGQQSLERLSVSFFCPHYARHHGGTGANIAWNLRLLRQEPLLVGTVGADGGSYLALLEERGVSTHAVERLEKHVTAVAIIGTDSAERQITFFHPGADVYGSWPSNFLAEEREDIAYAIVGARDTRLMIEAMEWCRTFSVPVIFDPGQQVIAFSTDELRRLVGMSGGVIVNAYEWSLLSDRLSLTPAGILRSVPWLIVTQGEKGAVLYSKDVIHISACPPEKLVNPTGAGDGFRAGLLMGLSHGWTLEQACRLGSSVASFVVEVEGTLLDTVDLSEVWERARRTCGEELPLVPGNE